MVQQHIFDFSNEVEYKPPLRRKTIIISISVIATLIAILIVSLYLSGVLD
jgi:hypothetical protein